MLQISETAAAALQQARSSQQLPETFGVRISGKPTDAGEMDLMLGFVEQPAEGDQVAEQAGTQVFVAPEVAEPLADALLDVQPTPDGAQLVITTA